MCIAKINSPIGIVTIKSNEENILEIDLQNNNNKSSTELPECLEIAKSQLIEYFLGDRKHFNFPYLLKGTKFQIKVWKALLKIPYGETVSYKDIAEMIGSFKAYRAVGNANNKNKLPIVIPCHRVITAHGKIGGYGGGIDKKIVLLNLEKRGENEKNNNGL